MFCFAIWIVHASVGYVVLMENALKTSTGDRVSIRCL